MMPNPARRASACLWQAAPLVALIFAVASYGAGNEGQTRQTDEAGERAPDSAPLLAVDNMGRIFDRSFNMFYCGRCPRDPNLDWRSDFSNSFLGEGETCSYAPTMLVDGDRLTGWAEGDEGDGIGVEVVVPSFLDLTAPVRIWAGYGKSAEIFAANGRPKRVRVTVLRLRAMEDPDSHDATGCSAHTYVEPVVVAGHEVDLRDFNGYQELPIPDFRIEHYLEYPKEWLLMDGTERVLYQEGVDAGDATPYEREPTEYPYLLGLTLLEVYPGTKYPDTFISEVSNGLSHWLTTPDPMTRSR